MNLNYAIQVKDLRKSFNDKIALEHVNFEVEQGEIFGLLGPSGSGKTTTIKILTGELKKTAGDVSVLSMTANDFMTSDFKSQIGILSDNSALYERLTVYDNLKLFCKLYGASLEQIDKVLREVNMEAEGKTVISKLSRGMKQRVLLGKALIHKPKLVFLDEPTSALDPGNMAHIHKGLRALNKAGTTIFLTTHNMDEATKLCDRVAFLHKGSIQEIDAPDHLRYNYSSNVFHVETFTGEKMSIKNEPENAEQIKKLIAEGSVKKMDTDYPTLGEIFLEITGKELV